ncbi:Cadherin-related tumor suppressor [Taenia solium]|eukprot:TsM_000283700 transcript=TsM_000283700 gene=TsM_000283700
MTEESKIVQQYFDVRTITPGYAKLFIRQSPDLDTGIESQSSATLGTCIRRSRDFILRVIATDNGSPRRHTSEATVTVRVLDVNDITPKISVNFLASQGSHYQGNLLFRGSLPQKAHGVLMENVERSVIAFVSVRDLDSGPWGQVTCRTDNEAFKLIPIGENPPEVDSFEEHSEIEPRSANKELSFKLMTQKPFDREEIQQVPFRIVCIDSVYKTGQTQTFFQDLSPPSLAAPSSNDVNGGRQLTIVTDRARQLTAVALVSIRILDENDCAPEFSQTIYTFSEEENVPDLTSQPSTKVEGKPVGIIQARDRDLDPVLTYTLLSNPQDAFRIDSKSGTLYIVRPFDREAFLASTYEGIEVKQSLATNESIVVIHLSAQVSDGKHTAHAEIQVTITDVNDCPPIFEKTAYEFFVEENYRPLNGHPIGTVKAHDSDVGLNGKIIYRLQPITDHGLSNITTYPRDYNPARHFKIDPNTGSIHALRPLDREQYIHHIFHVVAIDTSDGQLYHQTINGKKTQFTATTTVTVIVNDENDNAPTITFPASHTTLRVEVGAPAGQQIFTVTSIDPDAGENGTVRYSLRQSTPLVAEPRVDEASVKGAIFSVDEQTGIVLLTEKLPSNPTKYLLTIEAHDLGSVVQRNTSIAAIIHVVAKNQLEASVGYKGDAKKSAVGQGEKAQCFLENCSSGVRVPQTRHRALGSSRDGGGSGRSESDGSGGEGGQRSLGDLQLAPPLPLPPSSTTVQPFAFLTDRIIIFVLSSIFVVLLVVTVVLILLIRRRRFVEINTNHGHKDGPKVSQIQNNIARGGLPCATNTLQLIRNDEVSGSKAVFYRTGLPSDGTSHSDSEARSINASETFPVNGEDPYTLLKPLSRNQGGSLSSNEMGYRSYNHCATVSSFPALVPIQNATASQGNTQSHAAVLYSTSDKYSNGFAHIYPVYTTTRIASHQNVGGTQRTSPPGNSRLLTGLVTQPRKCPSAAATTTTATYTEMSGQLLAAANNDGDTSKYEYQLLLQQKMPVLIQHRPSAGRPFYGEKLVEFPLQADAWPSTSQGPNELMSSSTTKTSRDDVGRHAVKSASLQPMGQSNSSGWNSDLDDTMTSTTLLQPHKMVKFSASSISLNKLTPAGDGLPKTAQSSYV